MKNVHPDIFLFLLFDSPILSNAKNITIALLWLYFLVCQKGIVEPRREKCPPGHFSVPPFRFPYLKQRKKHNHSFAMAIFFGVPKGNRTPDLSLRRGALYPTELLTHLLYYNIILLDISQYFLLFSLYIPAFLCYNSFCLLRRFNYETYFELYA